MRNIEEYVKDIMSSETAHDFKHVDRVRNWAIQIAESENYTDLKMVEIAALMHDIGLPQSEPRNIHGEVGAKMAREYLVANNILSEDKIADVCNAIRYHNANRKGEGVLLNIIRDADMMDMFGSIGIMRAYTSKADKQEYDPLNIKGETWEMTAKDFDKRFDNKTEIGSYIIDQINFQISCYDNLQTESGKKLAKPLIKFMKEYIIQLETEIKHDKPS
ncbi:HD domain-containing protein [Patescibacteria group bacterium]|nr:HD domain-containing protein [Patescibacteria group bacterium]